MNMRGEYDIDTKILKNRQRAWRTSSTKFEISSLIWTKYIQIMFSSLLVYLRDIEYGIIIFQSL